MIFLFSLLFPPLENLEGKFMDLRFSLRGNRKTTGNILLVAIDDPSFREINVRWPWPRDLIARGISALAEGGAKTIALDIALSEESGNPGEDLTLKETMERAGNLVLPTKFEITRRQGFLHTYYNEPIELFRSAGEPMGYINLYQDPDGTVRRVIVSQDFNGPIYYPFALESAAHFLDSSPGELILPHSTGNSMLINYAGPGGTFETKSFYSIVNGDFKREEIANKLVIIGATFKEAHDRIKTPFFQGDGMAGMEVHGNIMDTLLSDEFLTYPPRAVTLSLLLLVTIAASLAFSRLKPFPSAGITVLFLILLFSAAQLLFTQRGLVIELAAPFTAVILLFLAMLLFHYLIEEKSNRYVRTLFSRFVSPQVVDKILTTPEGVALGGEIREVTLFFSDIRGFTTLSEQLPPEEVVLLLNRYFEAMSEIIFSKEGTLNKFIGDAIMAFYGAPIRQPDSAIRAVTAALEMRTRLAELNREWEEENRGPLRIGMGIHKGRVLVGNIGSSKQMEYTVIGDDVNVASRIESLTKECKCDILISDTVYREIEEKIEVNTFPDVAVKGRQEKITVHALLGWKQK